MMKKRILIGALLTVLVLTAALFVSPWPGVLIIRAVFDSGAERASAALAPKVPTHVKVESGLSYDPADSHALFDIYRGASASPDGPTIVWFHGGGFVSGRRQDVANYLKILAGRGFTVVNVDYTVAPEAAYPTPIRQANKALAYLAAHRESLGLNTDKLVLAGDSAGSQIAAQTAAMITNPHYARVLGIVPGVHARQLGGALLYCGVYDVTRMGSGGGILGWFVKSTTWAYSGERNWRDAQGFESMVISPYLTSSFPKAFISAGNADPLAPQSTALSDQLAALNVEIDTLFFSADHQPPLGHEYQFDLDTEAGRLALNRSVLWLGSL